MALSGEFWAGKDGGTIINGVSQPSRKWELETETNEISVFNHKSPSAADGSKWEEMISGKSKGMITIDCVLDTALAQPSQGATIGYILYFTTAGGHGISGDMVLLKKRFHSDANDGAAMVSYTARMTGPPTIF